MKRVLLSLVLITVLISFFGVSYIADTAVDTAGDIVDTAGDIVDNIGESKGDHW